MVFLKNISYDYYIEKYSNHKIVCIGAGGSCELFIKQHMEKLNLLNNITNILDNNDEKVGTEIQINNRFIKVEKINESIFENIINSCTDIILMILVSEVYIGEIMSQLDNISILKNVTCIYGLGTFQWGYTYFPTPYNPYKKLPLAKKDYEIPKIIHYCWFGNNPIPQKDIECINSWKSICRDYEIKKWDETNFDIEKAPIYVREAYKEKKYAFVSDYVRLTAVYKYGGIYLDTDVELFKPIDDLLNYKAFFSFMEYAEIATGLGFGAIPNCKEIKEQMDLYNEIPFKMKSSVFNLTPCPRYTNDYFRYKGVRLDNSLQLKDDILFLPSDYFCPMTPVKCEDNSFQLAQLVITDNTRGIHWCNNSWKDYEEKDIFEKQKKKRAYLNNRILNDWKREEGLD